MTQAQGGFPDAMTSLDPPPPGRWVHGHEVHPTNSWINQTATFLGSGWATQLKNMCQIGSFSPGIGVNMNHRLASFYASNVNHRCKSVKCQRDFISCNASLLRKEPIAFQNKWVATLLTTKFPLDHPSGICSSVPTCSECLPQNYLGFLLNFTFSYLFLDISGEVPLR